MIYFKFYNKVKKNSEINFNHDINYNKLLKSNNF